VQTNIRCFGAPMCFGHTCWLAFRWAERSPRVFAHKYSDEVAGVVLIDTSFERTAGMASVAQDLLNSLDTRAE